MKAYCPKCGALMKARFEGMRLVEAECERGNMELSRVVVGEISRDFFEDSTSQPAGKPHFSGSQWYCPRDGSAMQQTDRLTYTCPTCGRDLRSKTLRGLVELHPHLPS